MSNFVNSPTAPPVAPGTIRVVQNEGNLREFLTEKQWPESLQSTFIKNIEQVPLRFFICDDSGSMAIEDGTIVISYKGSFSSAKCSRWKELTSSLSFHAEVAHRGCIATEFRFLNAAAPFEIGFDVNQPQTSFESMRSLLNDGSPGGGTPLCRHINEVAARIRSLSSMLQFGKKAVVVIATDGEASDGDVREALRPLKDLPVFIVLRFCTDEDNIIESWNNIDNELELNMDVIDDFFGESKEIHGVNPWITYGEPLHRMREFGVTLKELDNIDEKALSHDEMLKVCKLCLGPIVDTFPPPQIDMKGFLQELEKANSLTPKVWSSVTKKVEPWIHPNILKQRYHGSKPSKCIIS